MPNYYGLVVHASPSDLVPFERFICVADRADGTVWLIPVKGRTYSASTKYVPKAMWKITVEGEDESAFLSVIENLSESCRTNESLGSKSQYFRTAKDNLEAAKRAHEELYQAVAAPAFQCCNGTDELVGEPMNSMFGGLPIRKVGKIIVLEGEGAGEYIVVYESDSAYYAVPTLNVVEGHQIVRVYKDESTIIDEYKDDGFIADFIDRLEEFGDRDDMDDEEPYAFETIDSARTTARQLARCLESKGGGAIGAFERFTDALCGGR